MIELEGFTKKYGSKIAVSDFDMICKKNEITGLIGLNGAGKTTILKAVCARHFATSGRVLIDGVDSEENPEYVRSVTGFVQEIPNLSDEFKVSEFVRLRAEMFHPDSDKIENAITHVKKICALDEIWNEKIRNLSKGQKERVNFSQALINNPSVLVLDEPASGLDPSQIFKMRSLVKSLKKDRTILLSTHLMQEVEALCDSIHIIVGGKKVESGTIDEIIFRTKSKNLEEAFFKLSNGI